APGASEPETLFFSERHACPVCGVSYPEIAPRFFSFNSPHGACPTCGGLGVQRRLDPARVVPEPHKPMPEAFATVVRRGLPGLDESLAALAAHYRFRRDTPFGDLPAATQRVLLHGSEGEEIAVPRARGGRTRRPFAGIIPLLERRQRETRTAWLRDEIEGLVGGARRAPAEGARRGPGGAASGGRRASSSWVAATSQKCRRSPSETHSASWTSWLSVRRRRRSPGRS